MSYLALTPTQIQQALTYLGYSSIFNTFKQNLEGRTYLQASIDRLDEVLSQLASIDTQLKELRPDSMAIEVAGMRVSFTQHRAILKADGSTLLKELAALVGLSIVFNKYSGSSAQSTIAYW